jgi:AraC-like DNA-binding protein
MVLVRSGRFQRRTRTGTVGIDRLSAYVGIPSEPEHFAHPHGGDVCTAITFSGPLWQAIAGDEVPAVAPTVCVDARLDLVHRRLLAASDDVDYACAEHLSVLLTAAVRQIVAAPLPSPEGSRDHVLVAAARALLHDGHPASGGLLSLADELRVSPFRLSRAFARETGTPLTRYRNRLRVTQALDHLERDDTALAELATTLGFSDQAHFTRTIRTHLGHTPKSVRALLRTDSDRAQ